ncbi:uncharacterized protein LOC136766341 [Amia ocellicauda]|uniref:uncharacterized protein LOC136766341 n=1 Tax=Amia ocellicauda TaxID=2972642 RepID=UPI003463C0AE
MSYLMSTKMNTKLSDRIAALCLLFLAVSECFTFSREGLNLRCQCINKESRFVNPKQMKSIQLIPEGPHCKHTEILALLKTGNLICLDPSAAWVKIVMKKILGIVTEPRRGEEGNMHPGRNLLLIWAVLGLAVLLTESMGILGVGYIKHCSCVKYESRRIPAKKIKQIQVIHGGAHCRTIEVIAGLESGENICLNHHAPWVKRIVMLILGKKHQRSLR